MQRSVAVLGQKEKLMYEDGFYADTAFIVRSALLQ